MRTSPRDVQAGRQGGAGLRIIRSTPAGRIGLSALLTATAVLATLPSWAAPSVLRAWVVVLGLLSLASMWNLLAGFGGMVSIGQQAFVGIGAYSLLVLADDRGVDPFLAVPLAGLVAAAASLPVAAFVFRLRGGYFAVGTWVIAETVALAVLNNQALGAGNGRSLRAVGDYGIETRQHLTFWLALAIGVGAVLVVVVLLRTRLGLALQAVRDDEHGARALGIDVVRARLIVWVLAAGWTGMTGALIYLSLLRVQPEAAFNVQWTAFMIFIVVIGGVGNPAGPIVGTAVFYVLRDQLQDEGAWALIVLGSVAMAMAVLAPQGITGLLDRVRPVQLFPIRRSLWRGPAGDVRGGGRWPRRGLGRPPPGATAPS